ncbi:hypothetical protein ACFFWA_19890 [Actinomadura verrucosospora]|uniref:hypothetical protein n=1 Tax=Actinomadura verrucosospora TaxID=46165 RepID=UPI0031EA6788
MSARLTAPIRLTEEGETLLRRAYNNANPRPACILAILLTPYWDALFIDPIATNIETLEALISEEIVKGRIKHPYLYGRILYDKAFNALDDNKNLLTHKETMNLLEGTPAGVFQLANYVTGPYGLAKSNEFRFSAPSHWIPLYHCEDLSCGDLHLTHLTTGNAKISKVRVRVRDLLHKRSDSPSDWDSYLRDVVSAFRNPFSWSFSAGLIPFIGDAFSLRELRLIVEDLLDNTNGRLRKSLSTLNTSVRGASVFCETLTEAQAVQLILLCKDSDIVDTINHLILKDEGKRIIIPATEARTAIIATEYAGYFDITPECTKRGARFSTNRSLTLLRVRHLVSSLFNMADEAQRERLEWIIRDSDGDTFQERLDNFICQQDLSAALQSLIFDGKKNLERAIGFAGIGSRAREHFTNEAQLASAVSWRLGVMTATDESSISSLHQHGEHLRQLAMRTHTYTLAEQEAIRSEAANFFVTLEEILADYIKLATWALLRDHYGSPDGFVYHIDEAVGFCSDKIAREQPAFELSNDGKWTLGPMIQSFATLARSLDSLTPSNANIRPQDEYPHILRNDSPYTFLFKNRIPFLDLSEESKAQIISTLRTATKKLSSNHVDEIRNRFLHNNEFPSQDEIIQAVTAAQTVLVEGEEAGFLLIPASQIDHRQDSYGRRFFTLGTPRGKKTTFSRPSQHFLAGFPILGEPQLVIRSAIYKDSSEMLRLRTVTVSDYSERWSNFPRRRVSLGSSLVRGTETVPDS